MRAHRIFLSFAITMGCSITLQSTAFSQEYRGTWEQQRACTRKSPMWTGSWLAYGEILRNSAIGAARFLNKATMRPHVVRIATTGKGVTIEIMGKGVTTEIMGRSVTTGNTGQGVTTMTTNEGKIDCPCVASACDSFQDTRWGGCASHHLGWVSDPRRILRPCKPSFKKGLEFPLTNSPRAARRIRRAGKSWQPQVPGLLANDSRRRPDSSCSRDHSRRNTGRLHNSHMRYRDRPHIHMRCSRSRHRSGHQQPLPLPNPHLDNPSLRNLGVPSRRHHASGSGSNCRQPLISCLPHWSAKEPLGASRRCWPSRLR
jgi:hypothetical protein